MAFDYKKEYKEFYLPPQKPGIVDVPEIHFIAVRGKGNPNAEDGAYKKAVGVLYAVAYTLKMSARAGYEMEGFSGQCMTSFRNRRKGAENESKACT